MKKKTVSACLIAGSLVAASLCQAAPVLQSMKAKGCGMYISDAAQPKNTGRLLAFVDDENEHIFMKIEGQQQVLDFKSSDKQILERSESDPARIYENPNIHVELQLESTMRCGRNPAGIQDKGCVSTSVGGMTVKTSLGVTLYKVEARDHC